MRILAPLVLMLSGAMVVSTSFAAQPADRPPGIDAAHWVPLGHSIGIVLTCDVDEAHASDATPLKPLPLLIPGDRTVLIAPTSPFVREAAERAEAREPIHGYVMVKQGGIWRRLIFASH